MANLLLKHWQLTFLGVVVAIALFLIFVNLSGHAYDSYLPYTNIKLGMDFSGGTLYQVELQKEVTPAEIARIANIISQRVDPSGLKDSTVYPIGTKFIAIQLTETDPAELEKIEGRVRQQGKFEANLNGEIVFTGDQIRRVLRGDQSYGVAPLGKTSFEWRMPFVLNEAATESFKVKTFHQCTATGFSPTGQTNYDCKKTTFFLDRPNALIVISEDEYEDDLLLFSAGNRSENIPAETNLDELLFDSMNNLLVVQGDSFDETIAKNDLNKTELAIVSPGVSQKVISDLNSLGFTVLLGEKKEGVPWIWTTIGAKQIISLTPGITNEDVTDISQAQSFSTLWITGQRDTLVEAKSDLEELTILLESGSLPTSVKTISKETVSPSLGESFLFNVVLMGLLAALVVAGIIVIRYRVLYLAIPIFITGLSEIIITMGFLAIIQRPLDLAAFAGLIAAIGIGVDSEIVITDEILGKSKEAHESLLQRTKNALFIIGTSAFTVIAVMGPIVLFSRNLPGLDKLFGFAIITIVGAIIGITVTRPAFTKIVGMIVTKKEK